jgi:hypothetical protein
MLDLAGPRRTIPGARGAERLLYSALAHSGESVSRQTPVPALHELRAEINRLRYSWQTQIQREQSRLVAQFVQHWLALRRLEVTADE